MIIIPEKTTQCKQILEFMRKHGSITPLDALEYCGSFRLSARIKNLRDEGFQIRTDHETKNGKTYARYCTVQHICHKTQFSLPIFVQPYES